MASDSGIPDYFSSDDEVMKAQTDVDPFRHKIKMSRFQWALTYVLGVVLVPVRALAVLILLLLSWLTSTVTLIGISDEDIQTKPMTGWRKTGKKIGALLGRLCFRAVGFYNVKVTGEQADPSVAPILVAAPHSTFFDGFVVFWSNSPYIVSRVENRKIPLIGRCIDLGQAISVNREDPNSRHNTVKEIIRRTHLHDAADPDDRWSQLIIFPEGSTSNRKALMKFKPGAFIPAKPVQPVLVRYPNKIDTVTWTWNQPHGSKTIMFATLSQLFSHAEIEYMPVYFPSEDEKADPSLYATNVRQLMADALEVPTNDLSFEEVKAKYALFYKRKSKNVKKQD